MHRGNANTYDTRAFPVLNVLMRPLTTGNSCVYKVMLIMTVKLHMTLTFKEQVIHKMIPYQQRRGH